MKRTKKVIAAAVITGLMACASYGAFKDWGWGTRPAGMGGAFTAISDDINGVMWNPAGLAQLKKREATFMYAKPYMGLENVDFGLLYAGFGYPLVFGKKDYGVGVITMTDFNGAGLYKESSYQLTYAKEFQKKEIIVEKSEKPISEEKIIKKKQNYGSFAPAYIKGKGVNFVYEGSEGKVSLVGNFNNWDFKSDEMAKNNEGLWEKTVPLSAGKYEYRFMADDKLTPEENLTIIVKEAENGELAVELPIKEEKVVEQKKEVQEKKTTKLGTKYDVGINVKYLSHKYFWSKSAEFVKWAEYYGDPVYLAGDSASAITADIGVLAGISKNINLGLCLKNITQPDLAVYSENEDKVPMEVRGGIAYKVPYFRGISSIITDLDIAYRSQEWGESSDKLNVHFGGEGWLDNHIYGVRLGMNMDEVTLGGSYYKETSEIIENMVVQLDYAFVWSLKVQDNIGSHRITTTVKF